jgi:hypothetical protein
VGLVDYSRLRASYGKCQGDAGFQPLADFNGDNCVTISDYSRLRANHGMAGPLDAPAAATPPTHCFPDSCPEHPDPDAEHEPGWHPHADAGPHAELDGDRNAHADANVSAQRHIYVDAQSDAERNVDSDSDADFDTDGDPHAHCHTHADPIAHSNPDGHTDADAQARSGRVGDRFRRDSSDGERDPLHDHRVEYRRLPRRGSEGCG